jgi:hypothetical protein
VGVKTKGYIETSLGWPYVYPVLTGMGAYGTPTVSNLDVIALEYLNDLCTAANALLAIEPSNAAGSSIRWIPLNALYEFHSLSFKPESAPAGSNTLPYHRISSSVLSDDTIINSASFSRVGGAVQTVTDAASIAAYGIHSLSKSGLLLTSDADVAAMAADYIAKYKNPIQLIEWIEIEFGSLTTDHKQVLFRYLFDLYKRPGIGHTVYQHGIGVDYCQLGIQHVVSNPHTWTVRIYLSPASLHS